MEQDYFICDPVEPDSFENQLLLETIQNPEFPNLLKQTRPKVFDRLKGRLASTKKEIMNIYRKKRQLSK